MEIDANNQNVVRFEPSELTDYIEETVQKMVADREAVEKVEDYDRLLTEAASMKKKMEELEAKVTAQAKALAAQPQVAMKAEDEPAAIVDDKKDEDDEDEKRKKAAAADLDKVGKLEAELEAIKASPMYKSVQDDVTVEKTEAPAKSILGSIISAHFTEGGN